MSNAASTGTAEDLLSEPYLEWVQLSSIVRRRSGEVVRHDVRYSERPELRRGETELLRILTDECGRCATIDQNSHLIGVWDGRFFDGVENGEELYEQALILWIETLRSLLEQ